MKRHIKQQRKNDIHEKYNPYKKREGERRHAHSRTQHEHITISCCCTYTLCVCVCMSVRGGQKLLPSIDTTLVLVPGHARRRTHSVHYMFVINPYATHIFTRETERRRERVCKRSIHELVGENLMSFPFIQFCRSCETSPNSHYITRATFLSHSLWVALLFVLTN